MAAAEPKAAGPWCNPNLVQLKPKEGAAGKQPAAPKLPPRRPQAISRSKGERMFGYPDPDMDPDEIVKKLRSTVEEHAEDAFQDLHIRFPSQPKN